MPKTNGYNDQIINLQKRLEQIEKSHNTQKHKLLCDCYLRLAELYAYDWDLNLAEYYINKILEISDNPSLLQKKAEALRILADIKYSNGDILQAFQLYSDSYIHAEKIDDHILMECLEESISSMRSLLPRHLDEYINQAIYFERIEQNNKAIENYTKALEISRFIGDNQKQNSIQKQLERLK